MQRSKQPLMILSCQHNSHYFEERNIVVNDVVKVGRAVARAKAAPNNAIFDCKVLSRNHAIIWFSSDEVNSIFHHHLGHCSFGFVIPIAVMELLLMMSGSLNVTTVTLVTGKYSQETLYDSEWMLSRTTVIFAFILTYISSSNSRMHNH
ncbi:unnamed protein product [Schistocephalus solidus]|uniref:FHA domain-containing protein n=1 Tax=Schistocephalus solidus TaxID=70667 RepID=A0A183STR2_SCHSO|nr:unnamed protein product [Schistocephalus solidus]